jgi:hypothetical protein
MKRKANNKKTSLTKVNEDITRKEALQKAGKYAAVTAAAMLIILSPKDSQADSLPYPSW